MSDITDRNTTPTPYSTSTSSSAGSSATSNASSTAVMAANYDSIINYLIKFTDDLSQAQAAGTLKTTPQTSDVSGQQVKGVLDILQVMAETLTSGKTSAATAKEKAAKLVELKEDVQALDAMKLPPSAQNIFQALESLVIGKGMQDAINNVGQAQQVLSLENHCMSKFMRHIVGNMAFAPSLPMFPGNISKFDVNIEQWKSLFQNLQQIKADMGLPFCSQGVPINPHVKVWDSYVGQSVVVSQLTKVNREVHIERSAARNQELFNSIMQFISQCNRIRHNDPNPENWTMSKFAHDMVNLPRSLFNFSKLYKINSKNVIRYLQQLAPGFGFTPTDVQVHMHTYHDVVKVSGYKASWGLGGTDQGMIQINGGAWNAIIRAIYKRVKQTGSYQGVQSKARNIQNIVSSIVRKGAGKMTVAIDGGEQQWLKNQAQLISGMYSLAKEHGNASMMQVAAALRSKLNNLAAAMNRFAHVSIVEKLTNKSKSKYVFDFKAKVYYNGKAIANNTLKGMLQSVQNAINNFKGGVNAEAAAMNSLNQQAQGKLQIQMVNVNQYFSAASTLVGVLNQLQVALSKHSGGQAGG